MKLIEEILKFLQNSILNPEKIDRPGSIFHGDWTGSGALRFWISLLLISCFVITCVTIMPLLSCFTLGWATGRAKESEVVEWFKRNVSKEA